MILYLIKGAIFRLKYATNRSTIESLDICPLGELIDMYHTYKASKLHDKVYALLGMSSMDSSEDSLTPNYKVLWEELLQRLIKALLGQRVSVETWPGEEIAVIKSKGCILGQVYSAKSHFTRNSKQKVGIMFGNTSERLGYDRTHYAYWSLRTLVKHIHVGDIVCLLQGSLKPVLIRPCKDYFAVIRIAAFPEEKLAESRDLKWLTCL